MLLFAREHLQNVDRKATLYYDFSQSGAATDAIDDHVAVEVVDIKKDGKKDVQVEFLSGDDRRDYSPVIGFRSNPLVMYFLQWDVEKMDAASQVSQHFFRDRIRNAFVDQAQSKDVGLTYGGRRVAGKHITLEPFVTSTTAGRYSRFIHKRYEFVLSDAVPGGIYSIKTVIPGSGPDPDKPDEQTALTFRQIQMQPVDLL